MVSTIFTVCSLKASRTETDIATATIVIKTSCSILTRAAGTCHDFYSWSIAWEREREIKTKQDIFDNVEMSLFPTLVKMMIMQIDMTGFMMNMFEKGNNLKKYKNRSDKYHFHSWFPQSQQDRDRHSHCHHCDQNKLLHSDKGCWHMPRFLQLEYSVRERERDKDKKGHLW